MIRLRAHTFFSTKCCRGDCGRGWEWERLGKVNLLDGEVGTLKWSGKGRVAQTLGRLQVLFVVNCAELPQSAKGLLKANKDDFFVHFFIGLSRRRVQISSPEHLQ